MRSRVSTTMDSDALQADVMRFMAIIAFCLVAVLALVRQIEPVAPDEPQRSAESTVASPTPEPKLQPEPVVERIIQPVVEPVPEPAPIPVAAPVVPVPEPPEPRPSAVVQGPAALRQPVTEVEVAPPVREPEPTLAAPVAAPIEDPAPAAAQIDAEALAPSPIDSRSDEGLTLRFATDQDFLRLVAKGDIRVFLFGADSTYRLRPDYRFAPATTPRQLFEVMPETVPAQIRGRATQLRDASALRYGLQFPDRIERQLDDYLARVDSGALLIDRYGRVSHVPSTQ
ncbi:MAG: hypothetical protein AAGG11_14540 [Pseudomonadota bacterium]